MIELTEADYERFCSLPKVQKLIANLEEEERSGRRYYRRWLIVGIVTSAVTAIGLALTAHWIAPLLASIFTFLLFFGIGAWPLMRTGTDFKLQLLEALADQHGLTYVDTGFEPPGYPQAHEPLFWGSNAQAFHDLIWGADGDRRFAIYEARIVRQRQKNSTKYFSGTIYAFQRSRAGQGTTVIVPDRGIFNLFQAKKGLQRINLPEAEEFERRFEVYSDAFQEAKGLLQDPEFRRMMLELREGGNVFLYVGTDDVLAAVTCPDRFEHGSMFKRMPARDRIRRVFDDIAGSLRIMKRLKNVVN